MRCTVYLHFSGDSWSYPLLSKYEITPKVTSEINNSILSVISLNDCHYYLYQCLLLTKWVFQCCHLSPVYRLVFCIRSLICQQYINQRSSIQLTSVHYMWLRLCQAITTCHIMKFLSTCRCGQDDLCGNTCAYSRLRVKFVFPVQKI